MFKRSLLVAMLATATVATAAPLTKDNGAPVGDNQNSITAGEYGSVLLQDVQLVQKFSVHDKFHRTLILSGICLLKIARISLNSSFFPKPIKR